VKPERLAQKLQIAGAYLPLAAGIILAVHAAELLRNTRETMAARAEETRRLRELAAGMELVYSARAAFESLPDARLRDIRSALSPGGALPAAETVRSDRKELTDGWTHRIEEIVFQSIDAPGALQRALNCETLRPPWRLTTLRIAALPGQEGRTKITMTFEGLEKASL